ncbi:MAG TPA: hypothetical protein P5556_10510 [Candidatus Gastranaerophilales bacterium]|nr:hypothetical protein [Candidatus Gastranaerophilales bacterium]
MAVGFQNYSLGQDGKWNRTVGLTNGQTTKYAQFDAQSGSLEAFGIRKELNQGLAPTGGFGTYPGMGIGMNSGMNNMMYGNDPFMANMNMNNIFGGGMGGKGFGLGLRGMALQFMGNALGLNRPMEMPFISNGQEAYMAKTRVGPLGGTHTAIREADGDFTGVHCGPGGGVVIKHVDKAPDGFYNYGWNDK